jgi:hypothetical protein
MELTTADKINALLMVFAQPKFWVQLAFVTLVILGISRAKRTARGIHTKVGRLGLVLHWASLLMAVALITTAGVILTQSSKTDDSFVITVVVGLAAAGVIVWLVGRSLRYILTGPSVPPPTPTVTEAQRSSLRRASVPPAGIRSPLRPWGSPRDT